MICIALFSLSIASLSSFAMAIRPSVKDALPNVVIIMADDLGYSDLGSYGGELRTPNIDQLAMEGVRFTQFTNTGRCCPSRVALLTGRNQHSVGMGWMTAVDEHREGYRGQLTSVVPTIAEIFKVNGYSTYMSGKWHVSIDGNYKDVDVLLPNGSWPTERGFDQFYGGLTGGGPYSSVSSLLRNETHIKEFADDYYYTTEITKHALEFVDMHDSEDPFFLYLAHYAPHRPMEAPEERIATYRDQYRVGYDLLREARFERMQALGILEADAVLPLHAVDFGGEWPAWKSLTQEQQEAWVEEMATYAAMVEIMDDGIGEVIDALKEKGMYEDTLIFFLSDNGATFEGGDASTWAAALSNTPFRQYKQFTHFGGIKSPLIIHYPKRYSKMAGSLNHNFSHIIDVLPTSIDIAGLGYPETFAGREIGEPDGVTLVPAMEGDLLDERDLFFEHQTASAVISSGWKLVRKQLNDPWELYDLSVDPFEQTDLAAARTKKATLLEKKWMDWAAANSVLPLETRPWRARVKHYKALYPDQDGIDE
ncbi:MAG TPA: arylsulfatase [Opitutae bacterium]|nr:arylsulfatase [Opitutae bacterium]